MEDIVWAAQLLAHIIGLIGSEIPAIVYQLLGSFAGLAGLAILANFVMLVIRKPKT